MAEQETYVDFQEAVYKRLSERGMDIEQLASQIYIKPKQLRLALQDADYLTWPLFWEVCTALEIKVKIELTELAE